MQSEFVRLHLFAGKFFYLQAPNAFPYEGKLSAVRLTDEVDSAA